MQCKASPSCREYGYGVDGETVGAVFITLINPYERFVRIRNANTLAASVACNSQLGTISMI